MPKKEHTAVRISRMAHQRLLDLQKTLSRRAQKDSPATVDVTISSVVDAAIDALETSLKAPKVEG